MNKRDKKSGTQKQAGGEAQKPSPPAITIDLSVYEELLEDEALTDAEKQEFLQTLWMIVTEFVSFGFGVHPIQQAQKDGESVSQVARKPTLARLPMVNSSHPIIEHEPLNPAVVEVSKDNKVGR